jgi:hypothetical protein
VREVQADEQRRMNKATMAAAEIEDAEAAQPRRSRGAASTTANAQIS